MRAVGVLLVVVMASMSSPAWAAPGDPGEPVRLNGDLPARVDFPKCNIALHRFSPDGEWVVYEAREEHRDRRELFAVRSGGGDHHKVNDVEIPDHTAAALLGFSDGGTTLVYVVEPEPGSDGRRIYATPIAGGAQTLLASPTALAGVTTTPDGSTVVYLDEVGPTTVELFKVAVSGGPATSLGRIENYSAGTGIAISPDSTTLVFGRRFVGGPRGQVERLFAISLDGGDPIPLDPPIGDVGHVRARRWQISPDSSHVVLVADRRLGETRVDELFSAPLDGSPGARLTRLFPEGGDVKDYLITPDSSRVIYRGDQLTNKQRELFSVPIGGGTRTRLNGALPARGDVSFYSVSPDSSIVLYRADGAVNNRHELYSVPIDGGDPIRLNDDLVDGGDVKRDNWTAGCTVVLQWSRSQGISPDSTTVVYTADQEVNGKRELYAVPIGGGTPVKLNPSLVDGGDVKKFAISPNADRLVYIADQDTNNTRELYSVPIGGGSSVKLSGPFPDGGDMGTALSFGPNAERVVYVADQLTDNVRELFSVAPN